MADDLQPVPRVTARGASYAKPGYPSFEFADFEVRAGEVTAVLASTRPAARDLLLAVAGVLRPTSGALTVCGVELTGAVADRGLRGRLAGLRRPLRLGRGIVGLGAVSGLAVPEDALTVEEVVARELARAGAAYGADRCRLGRVLDYLGRFQLATRVDVRVGALPPLDRARLSAALAFTCKPQVACIDAGDPFCAGMSAGQDVRFVRELSPLATAFGAAVLVATNEPSAAAASDAAVALDVDAGEALKALAAPPDAVALGAEPDDAEGADA